MTVHVVGNACIDTTFRLPRFALAGETLNASSHFKGLGGKGANQAVAAARTGAVVALWTAIGRDGDGRRISDMLAGEIAALRATEFNLPSDCSTIAVDAAGENFVLSGVACAEAFDPIRQTALATEVRPFDVVVLQGNLSSDATNACLTLARAAGAKTIFNASPLAVGAVVELACVDVVIVNEGEALSISGMQTAQEAATILLERGARSAVITLGARGCLFLPHAQSESIVMAAPAVKVVDSSGAGDVLCGVFAGYVSMGLSPLAALAMAVQAAALAVTRQGTMASCPSAADLASILKTTGLEEI
ncbi:PfkB family carbohydrate kinase [Rhizobium sp. NFR03]|uniref:PfkB family carbohydrate kinase n=1 Tax=Rhizobium sp. NFR03 TaxID=1566263 RepID=UPI0008C17B83|nr:PfkB family carbohydrate kinase [Rhizobium sp. NFR03]SES40643.1 ribokinase [Rhizobium sp. NFR03]